MKKTIMLTTALVLLSGVPVLAQSLVDRIAADFQSKGFKQIEIRSRADQIKAEGIRDGQKFEATYDKATGSITKQEWESADGSRGGNAMTSGTRDDNVASNDRSRHDGVDDSGDDENDDHGGDRAGNDDRGDDDHGGRGRGGDKSDDNGNDDSGSDDHGGDRGGNDDHGGGHGSDDGGEDN